MRDNWLSFHRLVSFKMLNRTLQTGHSKNYFFHFDECDSPTHFGPSACFYACPKPDIHAAVLARVVFDCGLGLYAAGFF
jgi:hypothetical protein